MFKQEFGRCNNCDCGKDRLIVNRTHWLCDEKNQVRLNAQKTETRPLKAKRFVKKTMKTLKPLSSKRSSIEVRYQRVQKEILNERDNRCDECGTTQRLSFSHLISRSRRPDLIDCKENIVLHCMTYGDDKGCHERWEAGDKTMKTWGKNLEIVKKLDEKEYKRIR